MLTEREADGLIVTGAETDVCVLATVLDAVDLGYPVYVVTDAVCSSSDSGHDAVLTLYHERFSGQIRAVKTEEILAEWPRASSRRSAPRRPRRCARRRPRCCGRGRCWP